MTFLNKFAPGRDGVRRWDGYAVRCDVEGCESTFARVEHPVDAHLPPDWRVIDAPRDVPIGQRSAHQCPAHMQHAQVPPQQIAAPASAPVAQQQPAPAPAPAVVAPAALPPAAPIAQPAPAAQTTAPPELRPGTVFQPPIHTGVPGPGVTKLSETAKIEVPAESKPEMQKEQRNVAGGKVIVETPRAAGQA